MQGTVYTCNGSPPVVKKWNDTEEVPLDWREKQQVLQLARRNNLHKKGSRGGKRKEAPACQKQPLLKEDANSAKHS